MIARVPVMLGSSACHLREASERANECMLDQLGFFLINGQEKVLLSQEKLKTNAPFVFVAKPASKFAYTCECRSCHELKLRSTSTVSEAAVLCACLSKSKKLATPTKAPRRRTPPAPAPPL